MVNLCRAEVTATAQLSTVFLWGGIEGESKMVFEGAYVWANRLLWPVACGISGLTAYWTLALPHVELVVKAGGWVFAIFAVICAFSSLLWWCDNDERPPT